MKKAITEYFRQGTQTSEGGLTSHDWTVTNEVSSLLDDVSEATIRMKGATGNHFSQAMFIMREVIDMLKEDKQPIRLPDATVLPVPDGTDVLDVLTSLSDCRQEPVEKMERRISGVSYMYWMDFYNEIFSCGFSCARLISVSFWVSFTGPLFRLPRRGLPRPTALFSGYHAEGYHDRTDAFKLTGYHVCRVTTPELPRFI